MSKSLFYSIMGSLGNWKKQLNEPFSSFFFFDPILKGFALTPSGYQALSNWITSLRRVLQDREEFYSLKFGRWSKAQIEKRRLNKRFYKLPEAEQIRILREYYALPYRTDAEKRIRRQARLKIRHEYDLINWDLLNAVRRYGDIVKSVRQLPHLVDLFPAYRKPNT